MISLPDRIETARLRGRRITGSAADLAYVIETDSDPRIQLPIFGRVHTAPESQARLERWLQLEREHGLGFYVFDDLNANRAGHAGLFPSRFNPGNIEVGYALKPGHWGHGYATEMTMALLDLAFGLTNVPRVIAITAPQNQPSRRVLEKAGLAFEESFTPEGGLLSARYAVERERWRLRRSNPSGGIAP